MSEAPGVQNAPPAAFLSLVDPRLARGKPETAKVSMLGVSETLTAEQARELASALEEAAGKLDEINATCLPHLEAFAAAVETFFATEAT